MPDDVPWLRSRHRRRDRPDTAREDETRCGKPVAARIPLCWLSGMRVRLAPYALAIRVARAATVFSHRQVAAGFLRVERLGRALVHDLAAVHDVDVVG